MQTNEIKILAHENSWKLFQLNLFRWGCRTCVRASTCLCVWLCVCIYVYICACAFRMLEIWYRFSSCLCSSASWIQYCACLMPKPNWIDNDSLYEWVFLIYGLWKVCVTKLSFAWNCNNILFRWKFTFFCCIKNSSGRVFNRFDWFGNLK